VARYFTGQECRLRADTVSRVAGWPRLHGPERSDSSCGNDRGHFLGGVYVLSEFVRELRVQFPNGKMALSGVDVTDEVVSEFQTIKLGKKYSYIQMKISGDDKVR